MPYTHSLEAAVLWTVVAIVLCKYLPGVRMRWPTAAWIGLAVLTTGKDRDFQEEEHAAILYIFGLFFYMLYVEFQMKISS
jgi:hypothetical protein